MNLLFFTPHAAIWAHTAPEAYLARAQAELGHSISYLTCGKAFSYCAAMTANRLMPGISSTDSAHICANCSASANAIAHAYDFPIDALSDHITVEDDAKIKLVATNAVAEQSLDIEYFGVKVGRIALYEFTLANKKMSTKLNESQWKEYYFYLVNSLRSLHGFANYLQQNNPDTILTFSPQYSNINSSMQFAVSKGIRVLFIESGTNLAHRLGSMRIWDWKVHKLVNPALTYWKSSCLNPITVHSADRVLQHYEQLLSGRHFAVFSTPHTSKCGIRERWNVKKGQKILLMTLSSYDEAYAAFLIECFPHNKVFSDVFRTQAEWIKATIKWVSSRPNLFLIIRVHPRDFPNKRDKIRSEQSFMLESLLNIVPSNVFVNWPTENVSLYELFEDADVILTGWSVTAIEALVLGLPVVTYDSNLPSYPSDIHYTGRSETEYYSNINLALADGWRLENAINGFRWLSYNFLDCTITVSNKFGKFELGYKSRLSRFFLRIWRYVKRRFPSFGYAFDLWQWRDALHDAHILSEMLENDYDSLPAVRKVLNKLQNSSDDRIIVVNSLLRLHELLYSKSSFPSDKPGLSHNIRSLL
tara:strand:+ start:3313 stop:5073 length:1761 start_codon:yes stop_codon:yes gene_type:complete